MTLTRESEALLDDASIRARFLSDVTMGTPRPGSLQWLRDRLAAIEAAVRAEQAAPANHPDDGHDHHFTCIRCGVNPPEQAAEVERLRALVRDHGVISHGEGAECLVCRWLDRAALAATPVAPAPAETRP